MQKIHDYDARKPSYASYAMGREFVYARAPRFIHFILYFIFRHFIFQWHFGGENSREMFPRGSLSFKSGSRRRVARVFGACDVYRNLLPREGFVKIGRTRYPLSRGTHTSPAMQLHGEKGGA